MHMAALHNAWPLWVQISMCCCRATLPVKAYVQRLAVVFAFFFSFIGCPIANQTFDFSKQVSLIKPARLKMLACPVSSNVHYP